jgi:hypothetical protein
VLEKMLKIVRQENYGVIKKRQHKPIFFKNQKGIATSFG